MPYPCLPAYHWKIPSTVRYYSVPKQFSNFCGGTNRYPQTNGFHKVDNLGVKCNALRRIVSSNPLGLPPCIHRFLMLMPARFCGM